MHVLIAGCGWLGTALADALRSRGTRVTGIRRSEAGATSLRQHDVETLRVDLAENGSEAAIPRDVDGIVACQSADGGTEESYRRAYLEANRTLLAAARRLPSIRTFVYTGSTGVFGQDDESTVLETTPVSPVGATARILAEAESLVLGAVDHGVDARLVRLSGLYGPGRTGIVDRVRDGAIVVDAEDDPWTNWCHRDDAVATVLAVLDRGRAGGIYHGTDAHPARRSEVVQWVAAKLGIEPPRRAAGDARAVGRRRGANRQISGEKTRLDLGITLRFPSFRDGLRTLLASGDPMEDH